MRAWAKAWAASLHHGGVLFLSGPLGAGKTTLVSFLVEALGSKDLVSSPTFALVHEYSGMVPMVHMDLYRLGTAEEFLELEEIYIKPGVVVFIEWPEKAAQYLLTPTFQLHLSFLSRGRRLEVRP